MRHTGTTHQVPILKRGKAADTKRDSGRRTVLRRDLYRCRMRYFGFNNSSAFSKTALRPNSREVRSLAGRDGQTSRNADVGRVREKRANHSYRISGMRRLISLLISS